jgi:hypothetical protein
MKREIVFLLLALLFSSKLLLSQQFNTDNFLTMPHGTGTFVITTGERNSTMISSFALMKNFEFFLQANLFRDNRIDDYSQHFTTSVYAKYMFWKNATNTGGGAVFFGFGRSPGYYNETEFNQLSRNIWTASPFTFAFFNNALSWDLMPGALVDFENGNDKEIAWGYTWSTRLAIYKIIPETAIVGEAYGTEGQAYSKPEYKAGLRWEPNDYIIPAITYSSNVEGGLGAGLEIGIVIFAPQFLKKEFIKNNHILY